MNDMLENGLRAMVTGNIIKYDTSREYCLLKEYSAFLTRKSLASIHYGSLYQIFFFSSVFFNPHDRHLYDFILSVSFSHIKFSPQHGHFIVLCYYGPILLYESYCIWMILSAGFKYQFILDFWKTLPNMLKILVLFNFIMILLTYLNSTLISRFQFRVYFFD